MNLITSPVPASFRDRSIYTTNNARAFAALKFDGSVVTWGAINPQNREAVESLVNAENPAVSLYESGNGFAALRSDGSAVLWVNNTEYQYSSLTPLVVGGTSKPITSISSDVNGFSGIYQDGTAFLYRGSSVSTIVPSDDSSIIQICSSAWGYAFVSNSGKVLVVTSSKDLNYSEPVEYEFPDSHIIRIFAGEYDYYGLSSSGSLYKLGGGGPAELEATQTSPIVNVANNNFAFAAIHLNGTVNVWGDGNYGAVVPDDINEELNKGGVVSITPSVGAFAALRTDGSILCWGRPQWSMDRNNNIDLIYQPEDVQKQVTEIVSSWTTFAARLKDGSVITLNGGSYGIVEQTQCHDVIKLVATSGNGFSAGGFAALTKNGEIIAFGDPTFGGDCSSVAEKLSSDVVDVFANGTSFAALKKDGSIVTWGGGWGSDSSDVLDELSSGIATVASYQKTNLLFLYGTDTSDQITGGSNNDVLLGEAGNDVIYGGAGADFVVGDNGNDTLNGDTGNDVLYGGNGNDTANAGAGDDLIVGGDGKGNDKYYGGDGIDTVKYTSATWGITVDLSKGTGNSSEKIDSITNKKIIDAAGIGIDQLYQIENIIGGNYNDNLIGSIIANKIDGMDGNDRLAGGGGNDILTGGSGNDRFVFYSKLNVDTNVDIITDFTIGDDLIILVKPIFKFSKSMVNHNNTMNQAAIDQGYLKLITTVNSTVELFYDPDGTIGHLSAIKFAEVTIVGGGTLSINDFMVG